MTGQLLASHFPTRRAILFPNGTLYSNAERRPRRRPRQSNIVPRSATIINYESLFAILPSMFLSSPKFFLSKTSVFYSFSRSSFEEDPNFSFPKRVSLFYFHDIFFPKLVSFIRFHNSSDPPSSSKFFLFKINVSPSFPRRILPQVSNFSFPKLIFLLRFHDPSSSSKFFLSKTSVSLLLPKFFESSLEFQILPFQN